MYNSYGCNTSNGADTMLDMAKRRKTDDDASKPKPNRTGVPLYVYVPPEIRSAIDELAERNRRPLTSEVLIALEAHLKAAGLWPPKKPAAGED